MTAKAGPGVWVSSISPDGCRHCGTVDRICQGRGLCTRCYQKKGVREQYPALRKASKNRDVVPGQEDSQDDVPGGAGDYGPAGVDGQALGEESQVASPYVSGERRPGAGSLPSSGPGASAPGKARRWWQRKKDETVDGTPAAPKTREKKPAFTGKRVSVADTISDAYGGIGGLAMRGGNHVPMGRMMQIQAPVAGEMLDEAAKGSVVDKIILQPIGKARGRFDLVATVLGPPLIVMAMETAIRKGDQNRYSMLEAALKSNIRSGLPLMVPALKKVEARNEAAAKAAAELFPDLPEGTDAVDAIVESLFGGWEPPPVPEPPAPTQPESETTNA